VRVADQLASRLSGTLSRSRCLFTHGTVILGGLALIVAGSSLVLALSTAWSVGDTGEFGAIVSAGLDYLPAELVLAGVALALFGLWPRGLGLAWAAYAAVAFLALLGPGLNLARWVLDLSPIAYVGGPPRGAVDAGSLAALAITAVALVMLGFLGFRRRDLSES